MNYLHAYCLESVVCDCIFLLCFVFGATFLHTGVILATRSLTKTKKSEVNWCCQKKHKDFCPKCSSRMALGPILGPPLDLAGPLFGQLWRSLRLCLVARLCWKVSSKFDSVQKPILKGRTGQQTYKFPKNSDLVCNIVVFFKIDYHNVLTFAISLHFKSRF